MNRRGNNDRNQPNGRTARRVRARRTRAMARRDAAATRRRRHAGRIVSRPTYGNSYGGYGAVPRRGGDGDASAVDGPMMAMATATLAGHQPLARSGRCAGREPAARVYGGGAVRRYGMAAIRTMTATSGGDRGGRRSGGDSDRGARYGDGGGRRSGGDSGNDSNAGASRERRRAGAFRCERAASRRRIIGRRRLLGWPLFDRGDRGDRGGSSAGRSSDGGGRSGGGRSEQAAGGGAVRRNPR